MESNDHIQSTGQLQPPPAGLHRDARLSGARRLLHVLLDLTVIAVVIVAIVLLVNPFPRWVAPPLVGVNLTFVQVLAYRSGALVLGAGLLFAAVAAGLLRLRWRVVHSRLAQRECPSCGSVSLQRTRRSGTHHVLGLLGIPVYRFICSDCRWQGLRAFKW